MRTNEAFVGLECTDTGDRYDVARLGRSDADAPLDPVYDRAPDQSVVDGVESMWDLAPVLPFERAAAVTADEGGTPLVEAASLAAELGIDRLLVKDEGRNPTGTVYDRGLSLAVTAAREHGADLLAHASAGNSGQSAAAYAGRADIRSYAFVPSRAPFSNKAMINVHGGEMRVVGGRYSDALAAVDDQLEADYHSLQEFTTPFRHEGAKTLAYELLADLQAVPDAVVVPVGTGEVAYGLVKGFRECRAAGLVDALPRVYAAQPSACAPVATALEAGRPVEPWNGPDTIVGELEIPDPAGGDLAAEAVAETGGGGVALDDDDILESAVVAAQRDVLEVGTAGGAAVAGAWSLAEDGTLASDETVVVVNTESATKTADILRSHLMGQGV